MNGWHRLWILITLLYGAVVVVAGVSQVATIRLALHDSARRFVSESTLESMAWAGASLEPRAIPKDDPYMKSAYLVLSDTVLEAEVNGVAIEFPAKLEKDLEKRMLEELYQAAVKDTRDRRLEGVAAIAGIWFVPSLLLLIVGHGVAWVRSGFKKKNA